MQQYYKYCSLQNTVLVEVPLTGSLMDPFNITGTLNTNPRITGERVLLAPCNWIVIFPQTLFDLRMPPSCQLAVTEAGL